MKNANDRDRDWPLETVGITGLRKIFRRDGGIEELYWGPSAVCLSLELYISISEHSREFILIIIEININLDYISNNNLILPIFFRALIYYRIIISLL